MVFEFVEREVFRAALKRLIAAGAEKPGYRQQVGNVFLVVPAMVFGLRFRCDVDPYHQQTGAARLGHRSPLPLCPVVAAAFNTARAVDAREPMTRRSPKRW